jgi:hypothetical protein
MVRPIFRALVVAASLAFLAVFTLAALDTVRGGAPADPVEISLLQESGRIAHPRTQAVAAMPPPPVALLPGFPALIASVLGLEPPRLELVRGLALAATLFTALLLLIVIRLETRSWTLALAASAFALAGQGLFAHAPGVARPEALLVLLVLLAFAALRFFAGIIGSLLAGVLLASAFFVERSAVGFIAVAIVAQAFESRSRCLALLATTAVVVAASVLVLPTLLGIRLDAGAWAPALAGLHFDPLQALRFAVSHLFGRLGLFTLVAVLSFALSTQLWQGNRGVWIWLGAAAVAAGIVSSQGRGPDPGALLPSIVVLALLGTLSLQRVVHHLSDSDEYEGPGGEGVILAGLAIQGLVFLAAAAETPWVTTLAIALRP